MPAVQTSYSALPRAGFPGMIADMVPQGIETRFVETAAGIPFGGLAVKGTAEKQIDTAPTATNFVGVVVYDPVSVTLAPSTTPDRVFQNDLASVMIEGTVWVKVGVTVTHEAAAGYDATSGNFVLSTTASAVAIPNGRYITGASANGIAKLQLR
jgi:hypothetical protein